MPRLKSERLQRGERVTYTVNGEPAWAYAGENLLTALMADGHLTLNQSAGLQPRAAFCNMGSCYECQVLAALGETSEFRWVRTCMTPVSSGLQVRTNTSLLSTAHHEASPSDD